MYRNTSFVHILDTFLTFLKGNLYDRLYFIRLQEILNNFQSQYDVQVDELMKNTSELNNVNCLLRTMKESLRQVEYDKNEQKRLLDKYVETERILRNQMEIILNVVDEASEDAQKLHDKLDCKT